MSKIDGSKVIMFLQSKWKNRPCPMCGVINWNVQDSVFEITDLQQERVISGGPVIPVVPVICTNCGNTILVNALYAGVVDRQKEEKKDEVDVVP